MLLTLLRLIQGFALGGGWGGAVLLVAEHCPAQRRGFWTSLPQTGGPLGNLLSTAIFGRKSTVDRILEQIVEKPFRDERLTRNF